MRKPMAEAVSQALNNIGQGGVKDGDTAQKR